MRKSFPGTGRWRSATKIIDSVTLCDAITCRGHSIRSIINACAMKKNRATGVEASATGVKRRFPCLVTGLSSTPIFAVGGSFLASRSIYFPIRFKIARSPVCFMSHSRNRDLGSVLETLDGDRTPVDSPRVSCRINLFVKVCSTR